MINRNRILIAFLAAASLARAAAAQSNVLLLDNFSLPDGLITNEYAYWNPTAPGAMHSANWQMTSGSLFSNASAAWTGVPDNVAPNAASSNGTNSAVFRMISKRSDFGDAEVSFTLLNQGLTSTPSTPAVDWDGVHVFLRYQSEEHLYYVSVNRRDNKVIIKKKVPGGSSNGGTYHNLGSYQTYGVPYNSWQNVKATVKNNADGSVTIQLHSNGMLLAAATDNGSVGGAPITAPGKLGIRGDNANMKFDDFTINSLSLPVDTIPPSVSIWAPASGAHVSGLITVSANAADNVGVAGVGFLLDGVPMGPELAAAPYSITWDTAQSSSGSQTLTAVARDAAGNRATSAAITVKVNRGGGKPR